MNSTKEFPKKEELDLVFNLFMNVNFVSLGYTSCGGKSQTWVLITAEIDFQSPPHLLLTATRMFPVSVTVTLGLPLAPVPSPMDSRRHTPSSAAASSTPHRRKPGE